MHSRLNEGLLYNILNKTMGIITKNQTVIFFSGVIEVVINKCKK